MGNPWGQAADAYGQGLNNLSQIELQGMNQRAQQPAQIADMFMQQYMATKKQKMLEAEQERRIALDEAMNRHRMEQEKNASARLTSSDERWRVREGADLMEDRNMMDAAGIESTRTLGNKLGVPMPEGVRPAPTPGSELYPSVDGASGQEAMGDIPAIPRTEALSGVSAPDTLYEKVEPPPPEGAGYRSNVAKIENAAKASAARTKIARIKADAYVGLSDAQRQKTLADLDQVNAMMDAGYPQAKVDQLIQSIEASKQRTNQGWAGLDLQRQRIGIPRDKLLGGKPSGVTDAQMLSAIQREARRIQDSIEGLKMTDDQIQEQAVENVTTIMGKLPARPSLGQNRPSPTAAVDPAVSAKRGDRRRDRLTNKIETFNGVKWE